MSKKFVNRIVQEAYKIVMYTSIINQSTHAGKLLSPSLGGETMRY